MKEEKIHQIISAPPGLECLFVGHDGETWKEPIIAFGIMEHEPDRDRYPTFLTIAFDGTVETHEESYDNFVCVLLPDLSEEMIRSHTASKVMHLKRKSAISERRRELGLKEEEELPNEDWQKIQAEFPYP